MGIIKLMQFVRKNCPGAVRSIGPRQVANRTLAVDASNTIYQFLIKTQTMSQNSPMINMPTDWQGNKTGHIIGILYRALMCFECGVQPIWVFDGPPPKEKYQQIIRRKKIKEQAQQKMDQMLQQQGIGAGQALLKYAQRRIRISLSEKKDAMKLVQLMGMPVVEAPGEAEPQCAQLCKRGIVDGVISEDMDTLVFGAQKLIRGFTKANITRSFGLQSMATVQISLSRILNEAGLTPEQFIDFCILMGCDYTPKIEKIGPVNAYKLIKQKKNIDSILQHIANDAKLRVRHRISEEFNHLRARDLFRNPNVKSIEQLENQAKLNSKAISNNSQSAFQSGQIREDQLRQFLLEKQFNIERVQNWLNKAKQFKLRHQNDQKNE